MPVSPPAIDQPAPPRLKLPLNTRLVPVALEPDASPRTTEPPSAPACVLLTPTVRLDVSVCPGARPLMYPAL